MRCSVVRALTLGDQKDKDPHLVHVYLRIGGTRSSDIPSNYYGTMRLEFFKDEAAELLQVLLMYGQKPKEFEQLCFELTELVGNPQRENLIVNDLTGFVGVQGCSLECKIGDDLGISTDPSNQQKFQCMLSRTSWQRVIYLLEPFTASKSGAFHQYLTEVGDIEWIISTERSW